MRAVSQAVSSASVRVNGGEPRAIGPGLMILLGVRDTDSLDIVPKLADKCAGPVSYTHLVGGRADGTRHYRPYRSTDPACR